LLRLLWDLFNLLGFFLDLLGFFGNAWKGSLLDLGGLEIIGIVQRVALFLVVKRVKAFSGIGRQLDVIVFIIRVLLMFI
jgi:hypothetical protein